MHMIVRKGKRSPLDRKWASLGGRNHPATISGSTMRMKPRRMYQKAVPGTQSVYVDHTAFNCTYQRRRHGKSSKLLAHCPRPNATRSTYVGKTFDRLDE